MLVLYPIERAQITAARQKTVMIERKLVNLRADMDFRKHRGDTKTIKIDCTRNLEFIAFQSASI